MTWSNETYICTGNVGATATPRKLITPAPCVSIRKKGTRTWPRATTRLGVRHVFGSNQRINGVA